MQKIKLTHQKIVSLLTAAILLSTSLSSCSKNNTELPVVSTEDVPIEEYTQEPDITQDPNLQTTSTATLMPVSQNSNSQSEAGLIIFSMGDGEYKHLFAYHPSFLPITRLTSDEWDDDYPEVNVEGTQIVFTSNRSGSWEVYILDLGTGSTIQMTSNADYESSPSWSPYGQYITYDFYNGTNFDIMIQSVVDSTQAPFQITKNMGNNFNPAYSPDGSKIAFVSDRSGRNEIWLFDLNNPDSRFSKVIGDSDSDYSDPTWSPDGSSLAWTRYQTDFEVQVYQLQNPDAVPVSLGKGKKPVWLPDGSGILATLDLPNENDFVAYALQDEHLMLPPITMSGIVSAYDWKSNQLAASIQNYLASTQVSIPASLWSFQRSIPPDNTNRYSMIGLQGVEAPNPFLSDTADDSFNQLRYVIIRKIGWDFLSILENAALTLTDFSAPAVKQDWLYTGRAIALNMAPFEAGWVVVSSEEYNGDNYWRVWVKCSKQDGTCGTPLKTQIWDFNSRYSGDITAYEDGGKTSAIPSGYWVDFTELAYRFGWERIPSENNWRSYFPGILFNTFIFRQGLTWEQALRELYPDISVDTLMGK